MKKLIALILTLALALCGAAMAEELLNDGVTTINTLITDGSFVIQIPAEDGVTPWVADDMAQDDSVVTLYDADVIEDTFVVRYDAVGDGDVTVGVRRYAGIACEELLTWDLHVADGAVQEVTGGSHVGAPSDDDLEAGVVGEWLEQDTQFTQLSIERNPSRGFDVEIAAPLTHGAYIFKTTIYYDCELDAFVYDKGKFWDVPITDSDEETELGEARVAGSCGTFTLGGDSIENATLTWYSDQSPEETVVFTRADAAAATDAGAGEGEYRGFEGSGVELRLPADLVDVGGEPVEGLLYNAYNDAFLLQVQAVDGEFADRDGLVEYFNGQEYIVRATTLEINGVELVYAEGEDDNAMVYSVIGPEGAARSFVFIPQGDDPEASTAAIEAVISTVRPAEA